MRRQRCLCPLAATVCILLVGVLTGCAGLEYAPKRSILYYHKELPAADRAIAAARAAGKDKECPAEFQAAEKAKNDAYEIYWSCRTKEGIAKANDAAALAKGLCPVKAAPPAPAPPPPPPPAPAPEPPPPPAAPNVSLSADPPAVGAGQCSTLAWTSENADTVMIEPGIGAVDKRGSRKVCPGASTQYTIEAKGAGGSKTASATVTVNPPPPPPPPPPAPKVVDKLVVHVNFDTNKATIRKSDQAELDKAVEFLKKYPGHRISVEGHTDNVGKDKPNQVLSEKRAEAVKKYLVDQKATTADKVKTSGYGKTRPVADNKTAEGRYQNRRVEIVILSE